MGMPYGEHTKLGIWREVYDTMLNDSVMSRGDTFSELVGAMQLEIIRAASEKGNLEQVTPFSVEWNRFAVKEAWDKDEVVYHRVTDVDLYDPAGVGFRLAVTAWFKPPSGAFDGS